MSVIIIFNLFLSTGTKQAAELKSEHLCYGIVLDSFVKHVLLLSFSHKMSFSCLMLRIAQCHIKIICMCMY